MPFCESCGSHVAVGDSYCPSCGFSRQKSPVPKAYREYRNPTRAILKVVFGLGLLGIAVLVILATFVSKTDRPKPTADQQLAAEYLRQAEECQTHGQKGCVKICAEKMYRLVWASSQRDGIDRKVTLDYWREAMDSGDLGYQPRAR